MAEHERFDEGEAAQGRNKLVSRMVLVVALMVALLAGVMIFEGKAGRESAESANPVAAALNAPRIGVSVSAVPAPPSSPVTAAEALPEELKQAIKDAPDSAQATLASMSSPVAHTPPAHPVVPEGSSDVATAASTKAAPDTVSSTHGPSRGTRELPTAGIGRPEATRPPPAPVHLQTSPEGRDMGPFILQVGVFSNPGNAEELRNKLRQAGIPTQVETRVQVGPFSSKEEAAKAQERLKKLGLGAGMLLPTLGKRP